MTFEVNRPGLPPLGRAKSALRLSIGATWLLSVALLRIAAAATDDSSVPVAEIPARPAILFNRWQEDWSVLANPDVPREPFDDLKYISLSARDPRTYLSLGTDLRERFESNDATNFGVGSNRKADYDIS